MLTGMIACRTFYRRFCTFIDITADEALPFYRFLTFPDRTFLDLFEIAVETAFVAQLDFGNGSEMLGYLGKAFFIGYAG